MERKKHQSLLLIGKKVKNAHPTKLCTLVNKSKVTSYVLKGNLIPQWIIIKSLSISVGTVNKILKFNLKLIKKKC